MRRFLTLAFWEARELRILLVSVPFIAFGISYMGRRYWGNNPDAVFIIWAWVYLAVTPFAASAVFGSERETGMIRFWDFIPVNRNGRWTAKCAGLLIILAALFPMTWFGSVLPLFSFQQSSLATVEFRNFMTLAFMFIALVTGGAMGGMLARKGIGGGLVGFGFGIIIMIATGILTDKDSSDYWPIFRSALGMALIFSMVWAHHAYFIEEDETRTSWFFARILLPRFIVMFPLAFVITIGEMLFGEATAKDMNAPALLWNPLILLTVFSPLILRFSAKACKNASVEMTQVALGGAATVAIVLAGHVLDYALPSTPGRTTSLCIFLALFTIVVLVLTLVYRRIFRFRFIESALYSIAAPLFVPGFLIWSMDFYRIRSSLLFVSTSLFFVVWIAASRHLRKTDQPSADNPHFSGTVAAFFAVTTFYSLAAADSWLAGISRTESQASPQLIIVRSTDVAAMDRTRRLFALVGEFDTASKSSSMGYPGDIFRIEEVADTARGILHEHKPELMKLERILAEGELSYPWPDRLDISTPLPRLFRLIEMTRDLAFKARLQILDGDIQGSARTIAGMIDFGRKIKEGGGPIFCYLVAESIESMGTREAAAWMESTAASKTDPAPIQMAVERTLLHDGGFRQGVASELEFMSGIMEAVIKREGEYCFDNRNGSALHLIPRTFLPLFFDPAATRWRSEKQYLRMLSLSEESFFKVATDLEYDGATRHPAELVWENPSNFIGVILFDMIAPRFTGIVRGREATRSRLNALLLACHARNLRREGKSIERWWANELTMEKQDRLTGFEYPIEGPFRGIRASGDNQTGDSIVFYW